MFQLKEHQTITAVMHGPKITIRATCSEEHCERPVRSRGICNAHYKHHSRHGIIEPLPRPTFEERLFSYINVSGVCWEWEGTLASTGYGVIYRGSDNKLVRAHRAVYEALVGPIPKELVCDHLCRNIRCVNPDHIELVTQRENILRGYGPTANNARKTHCDNGHEFVWGNMRITEEGYRICTECRLMHSRNRSA